MHRHPLREHLRGQLMLALYRAGRQSEALDSYADTRRTLRDELGLDPGAALRALHAAVLRHDPALAARDGTGSAVRWTGAPATTDCVRRPCTASPA